MTLSPAIVVQPRLPAFALFAALLAAAGLPVYIHAPKFYVDEYGVGLAGLGSVLFFLRLLDVVQDPLLGRLAQTLQNQRQNAVALSAALMALAMIGLFAVAPPIAPLLWFAVMLAAVFSAFSFLTILFYASGVATAAHLGPMGHIRLARWRETGALLGVSAAAMAPLVFSAWLARPFAGFAVAFALLALVATRYMRSEWRAASAAPASGFAPVLRDCTSRRLLLIAFLNATPVAVSATLFLFFVESRLAAPGWAGPLLLIFFLSAAAAAPLWGHLAERFGARDVLLSAMALAIAGFLGVLWLGPGDAALFAVICVVTGAAIGADLTLLPALFARRLAVVAPSAAEGFGLWSFTSKLTLAFAAIVLLPALDAAGFRAGETNSAAALNLLGLLYAGLPCILKLAAIALLATTKRKEIS